MTPEKETQLFENLRHNTLLKEWLQEQLADQDKILRVIPDIDMLRKAQGAVQQIQKLSDRIEAARVAAAKR